MADFVSGVNATTDTAAVFQAHRTMSIDTGDSADRSEILALKLAVRQMQTVLAANGLSLDTASPIATVGDGTGTPRLILDGALANAKRLDFDSAGVNNWIVQQNATTRHMSWNRADAAGDAVDVPFQVDWDDGGVRIGAASGEIGFLGTNPVTQASAYTPTNVSTDRAYDADTVAIAELADVVGTLIADLQAYGLLG